MMNPMAKLEAVMAIDANQGRQRSLITTCVGNRFSKTWLADDIPSRSSSEARSGRSLTVPDEELNVIARASREDRKR